jgi:hypothetical protein
VYSTDIFFGLKVSGAGDLEKYLKIDKMKIQGNSTDTVIGRGGVQ